MNKFKNWFYRFMYGRYGQDQLGNFLLGTAVVLVLLNSIFFGSFILSTIVWILLIFNLYRTYSKQIYKRRQENEQFLQFIKPLSIRVKAKTKEHKDKSHKYFVCPNCSQIVRIPKGRGKVTISCPVCSTKFDAKS